MTPPDTYTLTRRRMLLAGAATGAAWAWRGPFADLALGAVIAEYDDGNTDIPGELAGDPSRVIVVGAGFSGLAAANALRNAGVECVVLEGRRRLGGRARTVDVGGSPVDLGCSWIHEPIGNPMGRFADQAGIGQRNADIEADLALIRFYDGFAQSNLSPVEIADLFVHVVRFEDSVGDLSAELGPSASARDAARLYLEREGLAGDERRRAEFLLRVVLQQTDAIDWRKLSLQYLDDYEPLYTGVGQGNFPDGGYRGLVEAIAGDTDVRLGMRVLRVERRNSGVRVIALDRASGRTRTFAGSHVVITAPLGVLQAGTIEFDPPLPKAKRDAIAKPFAGQFEKVALTFAEPFWEDDLKTHIFHLSDRLPLEFPLFLDLQRISGVPTLVGLCSAHFARDTFRLPDPRILKLASSGLARILGREIPAPLASAVSHWGRDPFSRGSYSSIPVGASLDACDELAVPVRGRILFAGEATSRARIGYADGAFSTGLREAKRLLSTPSVQLSAG